MSNVAQAAELFNILSIEQDNGLELPEWTKSIFPNKLLPLAERNLALQTETEYMKRMKAGPLLTEIVAQMTKKRNGEMVHSDSAITSVIDDLANVKYGDKAFARTIAVYSGHDVTLVSLMRALDVIEQTSRKPDFAATLSFELHQGYNDHDDFEVKVKYG